MTLDESGDRDEVSVHELKALLTTRPELQVLDCREDSERAAASIAGSVHIPMQQIPARVAELDPGQETVVYCHHGMRSLRVTHWLRHQAEFKAVKSLKGGIDAWSRSIDPTISRY